MAHVLSICEAIGLPPRNFFDALFPPKKEAGSRLGRGLAQLHPEPAEKTDPETLVRELRESVDRLESFLGKLRVGSTSFGDVG